MKQTFFLILILISIIGQSCQSEGTTPKQGREEVEGPRVVGLQPFEGFRSSYLPKVREKIEEKYGFETVVMPEIKMPKAFFVNVKSPRYRADSIIRFLYAEKPDSIDIVLGLTHYDTSTTKKNADGTVKEPKEKYTDWGIFGLGFIARGSCVVSTYRLGRKVGESEKIERMQKVCLHEVGHTLGLPHCPNQDCFMRDAAESIKTIDYVGMELCKDCQRKF